MRCAECNNEILDTPILAVDRNFCSYVCHLRFWKDGLPNLGGRWISDNDIETLKKLEGQERELFYSKIVNFIMKNLDMSSLMLNIRYGDGLNR